MNEKKLDELQKLYDNPRIGAFVQEICEYYATSDSYEDNSYQDEIEPRDLTEAVYTLFCLQCREQILDELSLVSRKYPGVYESVKTLHNKLLSVSVFLNDYRRSGISRSACIWSSESVTVRVIRLRWFRDSYR